MEIPKNAMPASAPKTEWKQNVTQKEEAPKAHTESFGAQLNRMAGIGAEDRNAGKGQKNELSKESYLKMLMEQLKFQDPFNPVKNEQWSAQMTALGQLEQSVNTNKTLEKIASQNNNMQIAALQLVGKNILADRAAIYHDQDKASGLSFKLPQDAQEVTIEIQNIAGEKVNSFAIGAQQQGDISTKWNGAMDDGSIAPGGKYSYKVLAKGMDNKLMDVPSKIDGRVSGVTNSQGVTFLLVGDQRVGLNDIQTIKEGDPAGAPTNPSSAGIGNIPPPAGIQSGTIPESKSTDNKSDAGKPTPDLAIDDEAASALADSPSKSGLMSELMPILMR